MNKKGIRIKTKELWQKADALAFQFVNKNDWALVLECFDNFHYVYLKMPLTMQLAVDLRMEGFDTKMIASFLDLTQRRVQQLLRDAKKRILQGEHIL